MKSKRIINIVFYKYLEDGKEVKKACIFYRDGSIKNTTYEAGLDACEEIVKERKITSKNAFKEMINNDIVHVMSGEDFQRNFNRFVSKEIIDKEIIDEAIQEDMDKVKIYTPRAKTVVVPEKELFEAKAKEKLVEEDNKEDKIVVEVKNDNKDDKVNAAVVATAATTAAVAAATLANKKEETKIEIKEEKKEAKEEKPVDTGSDSDVSIEVKDDKEVVVTSDSGKDVNVVIKKEEKPKKEGFFKKVGRFFKNTWVKITAVGLALLVACGLYSCSKRQTKDGVMFRSNLTQSDTLLNNDPKKVIPSAKPGPSATPTLNPNGTNKDGEYTFYNAATNSTLVMGNNDYYDDYTFDELQAVTQNETQKEAMKHVHEALTGYNDEFAEHYLEEGKDIRAALTFDEIVALHQAYNDYSKEELRAIFNGSEIDAAKMTNDYKSGTLQLMGAHIIENSEHPVDMSMLLETEEGRDFYRNYHAMFLAAKEATGAEQLRLVEEFYRHVRADFPITDAVRMEGIAHADAYASIPSYKISVIPMIAASEMLFQNLEVDYTLNDSEVNFLNDAGLCNMAFNKYDKIEAITLGCSKEDNTNPLYEQYRDEMIRELEERGHYVIDDAHRELSELDAFKDALNMDGYWSYVGYWVTTTTTRTETKTWTETETETHTEEERVEAEIPEEEKEKIDEELEKENEEARQEAEEEAEEERERLQEEADEEAQQIAEEVKQDEEEMQQLIEDANDQIDQNHDSDPTNDQPVNESDFGDHNVDFNPEHEDGNGNLNDSVENITTDPTGDQTGQPLPDPNETGAAFDQQAEEYNIPTEFTDVGGEVVVDYDTNAAAGNTSYTNEELVNYYVEALANASEEDEYGFTK